MHVVIKVQCKSIMLITHTLHYDHNTVATIDTKERYDISYTYLAEPEGNHYWWQDKDNMDTHKPCDIRIPRCIFDV